MEGAVAQWPHARAASRRLRSHLAPDDELFRITKKGVSALVPGYESDMPPFEGRLSDVEIEAVLAFIKSTWPEREREYQAARTRNAAVRAPAVHKVSR